MGFIADEAHLHPSCAIIRHIMSVTGLTGFCCLQGLASPAMNASCTPRVPPSDTSREGKGLTGPCCPQVLANPSVDLLEGPGITKEQLKGLGVRPYGPKVILSPGPCNLVGPQGSFISLDMVAAPPGIAEELWLC